MSHYTTWIAADYRTNNYTTKKHLYVVNYVDSKQYEGITLPQNPHLLSTSKTENAVVTVRTAQWLVHLIMYKC